MDETWTLQELVAEAKVHLEALPPPRNGQVRAVPDDRTIRYYAQLALLDRPVAMRGRTALYSRRHLAQVVAIKRMQSAGHSLAEIQKLWPTLDDATLSRITGVALGGVTVAKGRARKEFWKAEPLPPTVTSSLRTQVPASQSTAPVELRLELGPGITVSIALPEHAPVALSPDDVRALRAAAAPLVTALAHRGLT